MSEAPHDAGNADNDGIDAWGIAAGYHDVHGDWVATPHATIDALRIAMGEPEPGPPLWFVIAGDTHDLLGPCHLVLEDGTDRGIVDHLPSDVPWGYHQLAPVDGGPVTTLVVHPTRCPEPPRAWGVAAQTYALWSDTSWGIGDLHDVGILATRIGDAGGGVLQLSPLHAPAPTSTQEASPYYPSTRRALSPLLIPFSDDGLPRSDTLPDTLPDTLRGILDVHPDRLIDRDRAWSAKRDALEAMFVRERWAPEWREWAHEQDESLWMVSRWNTIADDFGDDWTAWPPSLRHPDDPTFGRRASSDPAVAERLEFHAWCQWRARVALADAARRGVGLIADLAVGFSPRGADAWEFQDQVALGARIGAPPDVFNADGQDWGLPPFVPWKLRQALYRPLILTIRACLQSMAGLRIDHVMGLMRQYWIPPGGSPRDGAYVHLPSEEIFALVALEAARAGAFVIGEDLGTVAPAMRDAMTRWGILGTRVVLFEDAPPASFPEMSVATATTHDLPTIANLWTGAGDERLARHIRDVAGPEAGSTSDAIERVHDALLDSPARLRLLTTDDLCGSLEQPNHPGTVQPSNWSRPLPVRVQDIPLPRH